MNKESIKDICLRMFDAGKNNYPDNSKSELFESYWQIENKLLEKNNERYL